MKNHKIQIVFILVLVSFFNTHLSFADLSEGKTKLKFTEHGPFYGVKEDGKRIRGILLDPNREGDRSDWYGLFTNSDFYWKGYFKHTYEDGKILYQYNEL